MKNVLIKTACTVSFCAVTLAPVFAVARTKAVAVNAVTNQMLGVPEAAIIPRNPFYGIYKAFGTVKGSLLTDNFSRLNAHEELLNRRGAELLKTYAVLSKNQEAVLEAFTEYQRQLYSYTLVLNKVVATASEATPENLTSIDHVAVTVVRHSRFIDDMFGWPNLSNAHRAILTDLDDRFGSVSVSAVINLIGTQRFITLATEGVLEQPFSEQVRTCEMLSVLAKHAARKGDNDLAQKLLGARRDILTSFAQNAAPENISEIATLAGSRTERLQTVLLLLDMPQLRESSDLIDLKNQLLIQVF